MAKDQSKRRRTGDDPKTGQPVIQWLLDSDPSIRWQVLQVLCAAPAEKVAGARLLALQGADGTWAGAAWNRGWDSTMHVLSLLREMGLHPSSFEAKHALRLVHDHVRWRGWDWDGAWRGWDFDGTPFFAGEVEPCINGQVAASGAYFGQDVRRIVDRLLGEQFSDGGWNCEAANRSIRSSPCGIGCPASGIWRERDCLGKYRRVSDSGMKSRDRVSGYRFRAIGYGEDEPEQWSPL